MTAHGRPRARRPAAIDCPAPGTGIACCRKQVVVMHDWISQQAERSMSPETIILIERAKEVIAEAEHSIRQHRTHIERKRRPDATRFAYLSEFRRFKPAPTGRMNGQPAPDIATRDIRIDRHD
jgi:hypothetical protein